MPESGFVGEYRIERRLGSGAFATVWLAHDDVLKAPVAVKVLADNWSHDEGVRERFLEEARLLRRLDDEHVVRVYAVGELDDGRPYFVMEWADGGTLEDRLPTTPKAESVDEAVGVVVKVLDGLSVIHAMGVVHRDIKPSNILFKTLPGHRRRDGNERVLLGDLGLAKDLAAGSGFTLTAGTPAYMAPEQRVPMGIVDARSDLYAVAVLLRDMLTGTDLPAPIAAVIERGTATTPDDRFASAEEMANALDHRERALPHRRLPPTGNVTLLFSDIESSTRLWEKNPDLMATALRRHDTLLRSAIESSGGYVFKTVGDAFCAAFESTLDAVSAAARIQRAVHGEPWPDDAHLRVRVALHSGTCDERDGDYFGPAVNRTARLEGVAHGGQIVCSGVVADVAGPQLSPDLHLVALGEHYLKDLDLPELVFQVSVDGIPSEFPPLRTANRTSTHPTNLTDSVSSLIGRAEEVAAVVRLLREHRMVTLIGSGGVGKTRLAVEVGRTLLADRSDGVWLVELASVTDEAAVPAAVLESLAIDGQPNRTPLDSLIDVLADQQRLILLDNCEQVVDACATVADALIRNCPDVDVLATSREVLQIEGEAVYRVPSLSLPPAHVHDSEDLLHSGAVELFTERARSQVTGFAIESADAQLVAEICRRLDGIPLAIELASARLRSLSIRQLHDRLMEGIGILNKGSRVAMPRQQTLRALVDWSYELLDLDEQRLFRRLAVFVGGFDLESATGVCALDDLESWEVTDLLASLVDKSLVVAEPHADGYRYHLLETLRQYALEKLDDASPDGLADEKGRLDDAHAAHFMSWADRAAPHLRGRSVHWWMERLSSEEGNLRAALLHLLSRPDGGPRVVEHFWTLHRFWPWSGSQAQNLALLDSATDEGRPPLVGRHLALAALCRALFMARIDHGLAMEALLEAVQRAREAGDPVLEAEALSRCSRQHAYQGQAEVALATGKEAVDIARHSGDPVLMATTTFELATALDAGDDPSAEGLYGEALELAQRCGDEQTAGLIHMHLALLLLKQGQPDEARWHLERSNEMLSNDSRELSVIGALNYGWVLLHEDDLHETTAHFGRVLRSSRLTGVAWGVPYAVLGLACCATRRGAYQQAAQLHGGADALLDALETPWDPLEQSYRDKDIAAIRSALGPQFDIEYAGGRRLSERETIRLALPE